MRLLFMQNQRIALFFYDARRCRNLDFDIVTEFAKTKERKQSFLKGEHEQRERHQQVCRERTAKKKDSKVEEIFEKVDRVRQPLERWGEKNLGFKHLKTEEKRVLTVLLPRIQLQASARVADTLSMSKTLLFAKDCLDSAGRDPWDFRAWGHSLIMPGSAHQLPRSSCALSCALALSEHATGCPTLPSPWPCLLDLSFFCPFSFLSICLFPLSPPFLCFP